MKSTSLMTSLGFAAVAALGSVIPDYQLRVMLGEPGRHRPTVRAHVSRSRRLFVWSDGTVANYADPRSKGRTGARKRIADRAAERAGRR